MDALANKDFNYHVATCANWSGEDDGTPAIVYDATMHHLNISYVTDDQTLACNCGKYGDLENEAAINETDGEILANIVDCTYVVKGGAFVLKKKTIKRAK